MRKLVVALGAVLALAACTPPETRIRNEAKANETAGQAFLKKTAAEPGVKSLPSGLMYKVVREGPAGGIHPSPRDEVKVHYEGTLLDGTVFDSSYKSGQPVIFTLGNLIPGWVEGIQLMKPGDEFLLYVPAKLGYGDRDTGPIPPGSTLVFRIELLGVLPAGGGVGLG